MVSVGAGGISVRTEAFWAGAEEPEPLSESATYPCWALSSGWF